MYRTPAICRWVASLVLLVIAVQAVGVCWLVRPPVLPGARGAVASRVQVGMSQAEALGIIRASGSDNVDTFYARGATWDGRPISGACGGAFDALPPVDQVAWGELEVDDEAGRELVVALGPGGVVSDVRLSSPHVLERWSFAIWRWSGLPR